MATVFLCLFLAICSAQSLPAPMEDVGRANLPTQPIGADDLLAISVYKAPELTRTVRVESGGAIMLPLLKQPIEAAGLLPNQLERRIAEALKREGILVNPVVKVTVAEYASRPISVMGAVKKPLTFQAMGRVTLLDALARAEGLSPDAGDEILVSRPGADSDVAVTRRIPVKLLIDAADPAVNLRLSGGEEIRVPEAARVFVVGNVKRPGAFPMRASADASVLKVLAMAEGLAPFAAKRAYIYRQQEGSPDRQELEIELNKLLQRKTGDVPLLANDILYVPDNRGRRHAMNIVDRLTSFGSATASGILIWHR